MSRSSLAIVLIALGGFLGVICVCAGGVGLMVSASRQREAEAKSNEPPPEEKPMIAAGPAGSFGDEKIDVAGTERQFRLVVPESVDRAKPAPLVVAFHGMLIDSKDVMPRYTRLDALAADKKFLLAFPEAIGKSWGIAPDKVKADLAFFDALVADVSKRYRVDPDRIYVVGMSNGGYFAQVVAKERSKTVAAACTHSGPLDLGNILFGIKAERKFPVMIVAGDKDEIFKPSWFRDTRDRYRKEGHSVNYVEIAGLTHFWAEKAKINDQIWEFFAANPLK
jgi:polyhydroxybutyrate depolymerase